MNHKLSDNNVWDSVIMTKLVKLFHLRRFTLQRMYLCEIFWIIIAYSYENCCIIRIWTTKTKLSDFLTWFKSVGNALSHSQIGSPIRLYSAVKTDIYEDKTN